MVKRDPESLHKSILFYCIVLISYNEGLGDFSDVMWNRSSQRIKWMVNIVNIKIQGSGCLWGEGRVYDQ